jgi:hypothetical protein
MKNEWAMEYLQEMKGKPLDMQLESQTLSCL